MSVLKYHTDFVDSRVIMQDIIATTWDVDCHMITSIIGSLSNRIMYAHIFQEAKM